MKTIVIEHFNGILYHKSGPVNKQHTNQPVQARGQKKLQHPQDLLKMLYYDERPTVKNHTTFGSDDGGNIGKIIN